jgi:hypothetical protein
LDGSWDSKTTIVDEIGLRTDDLAAIKPLDIPEGDVWLTLFVVLLLRAYFAT